MTAKHLTVRKNKANNATATELALMVTSGTELTIEPYDQDTIVRSLREELGISNDTANEIANEVTEKLLLVCNGKTTSVTSSLIRDFINVILYERGNKLSLKSDQSITIPMYDITKTIEMANKENGNLTHCPESINFTLAERLVKEYALQNLFDKEVAKYHREGKIYVHDLGTSNRAYCSGHSPLYILKNGIKNIDNMMSTSAPANSAWTFARHLCSMTQFFSGMFSGAIGYDALNIFFAPLLRGWSQKKMKQLAQTLIFDLSQLAGAKGGQTSFTDFNIYLTVPQIYRNTFAMGAGGKFIAVDKTGSEKLYNTREDLIRDEKHGLVTGLRYKDFEKEAQSFARAIFSVIEEGDAAGLPFAFPKINMHVNEDVFTTPVHVEGKGYVAISGDKTKFFKTLDDYYKHVNEGGDYILDRVDNLAGKKLLMAACQAASKSGCPYFIFDRGGASISQCCRLTVTLDSEEVKKASYAPEDVRFVGVQNVTINLPNCAIEADKNEVKFLKELEHRMSLAVRAHLSKKKYLEKVMNASNSPLKFYTNACDGKPYVDLNKGSYLIGIVGLNECVYNMKGQEMHESDDAFKFGIRVIVEMNKFTKRMQKEYGLNFKLEETPAESCSTRLATLDKKKYGERAHVQSNAYGTYYTNSCHFNYKADMDYMTRISKQSLMHPYIEAGAMIHNWVGDKLPPAESIFALAKWTFENTKCTQWTISPEFTKCNDCIQTTVGLHAKCQKCGSDNVVHMERITGYYVILEKFNPGKKAEQVDRNKGAYIITNEVSK